MKTNKLEKAFEEYYFVTHSEERIGSIDNVANHILNSNPLQWFIDYRKRCPNLNMRMLFYKEITKEEYLAIEEAKVL